jgi:hypothetical protein
MTCKRKLAVGYQLPESERETYCREVLDDVNR